jgi:hypothetical protein
VGLDPQKIENKIQIKKLKLPFRNEIKQILKSFLSSRVRGRVGFGSGSGLKPRPLFWAENVDGVEVGKVDNVADVNATANANA